MSYDSNTKVALLNERFSKLLLVAFSSGFIQGGNSKLINLLHNYRGVESENRYDTIVNGLVDALYLSEPSSTYYDGNKLIFGTDGWYQDVNIHFTPQDSKIEIVDGGVLLSARLPVALIEYSFMIKSLADDILGKSKDFYAVPSSKGHELKRTY